MSEEPRGRGKLPFAPTEAQRVVVELLAGFGVPHEHMCLRLFKPDGNPITEKTLRKHFKAELARGRMTVKTEIYSLLLNAARRERGTAERIFLAKTVCGMREPQIEGSQGSTAEEVARQIADIVREMSRVTAPQAVNAA